MLTPKFAHLLDAVKMMAPIAAPHPERRFGREPIQPLMCLFK